MDFTIDMIIFSKFMFNLSKILIKKFSKKKIKKNEVEEILSNMIFPG